MKKYLLLPFLSLGFLFHSCSNSHAQDTKTKYTATEFAAKIAETPDANLVDVRTPEEFSKGHLENAKNIDWKATDFDTQIQRLDKTKPVLVYCLSGGRSSSAATKMRSLGFEKVYELEGGIMKWRAANLKEVSVEGSKPSGMTKQQFDNLLNTDKTVLIDFYADWCVPCQKMKPYLEEISKEMADKVVVVRINADDNQVLCKEMGIDGLPVLQVYKQKTVSWKNVGFVEKAEVVKQL